MTIATIDSAAAMLEKVLVGGDLSKLTPTERLTFYRQTCESLGPNPLTGPFAFIVLNNKLTLYAKRDCADQLRKLHNVSLECVREETTDDLYIVTMRATMPSGRSDVDKGAVSIAGLRGEAKANATMKATTKAKRRVTLSICGLGMLDETEVETIADARPEPHGPEAEGPPPAPEASPPPAPPAKPNGGGPPATPTQIGKIRYEAGRAGVDPHEAAAGVLGHPVPHLADLTKAEASRVIEALVQQGGRP